MASQLTKEILKDIKQALKQFGEYTYQDKGPQEVMDIGKWATELRTKPAGEAASVLRELVRISEYGETFASSVLCKLQDWDELFEQDGISDIL